MATRPRAVDTVGAGFVSFSTGAVAELKPSLHWLRERADSEPIPVLVLVLHELEGRMEVRDTDVGVFTPCTRERGLQSYIYSHPGRFVEMPSAVSGLERLGEYFDSLPGRAPSPDPAPAAPLIGLRFRRGDGWQSGRVRNLTATSIGVACGCPPSKDDVISIELRVQDLEVVVDAVVLAVTPPETAEVIGAYGFGARFFDVDAFVHHRLRQMVAIAASVGEPIAQPPRRRHPRFPVRWPVGIADSLTAVRAFAIDLSARGMFVASDDPAELGAQMSVSIPEELGERRLHLRTCVARALSTEDASAKRATAGFGLEIVSMNHETAARYGRLVERVARRARYTVLAVAEAERLARMTVALRAVGYPVTGTTDLGSLVQSRSLRSIGAAVVILDQSSDQRSRSWIEAACCELRGRGIPGLVMHGGPASRAWRLADSVVLG